MEKKKIVIIGATGLQGKSVANALFNQGAFHVRAVTRNPEAYSGQAHEAVKADLDDKESD
ncbi:MAG: NmrA family NAD(P)-binding protein [candidate division KSB1 bacterium]